MSEENVAAPVLALTILDAGSLGPDGRVLDSSRLLVGVRDPETHVTHPNVVSVPTQRFPLEILENIIARCETSRTPDPDIPFPERLKEALSLKSEAIDSKTARGNDSLIYAVESLLTRKLGLAEALEKEEVSYRAYPVSLLDGAVLYKERGPDVEIPGEKVIIEGKEYFREQNRMLNIAVELRGASNVLEKTSSYSAIRWIEVSDFLKLAETRDHRILFSLFGTSSIGLCVHGLCILSSYTYLKKEKNLVE